MIDTATSVAGRNMNRRMAIAVIDELSRFAALAILTFFVVLLCDHRVQLFMIAADRVKRKDYQCHSHQ